MPHSIADMQIKRLQDTYGVTIQLVPNDAIFYAPETIERSVKENIFFISEQSPALTARTTESLIHYSRIFLEQKLVSVHKYLYQQHFKIVHHRKFSDKTTDSLCILQGWLPASD